MKQFITLSIYTILLLTTFTTKVHAVENVAFNMRPGTWEVTTTSDLLRLVPRIPPDQMSEIKRLANEYGFELPNVQNGGAVSNTCITQEMADQHTLPNLYQQQSGCATQNATRNRNHYALSFSCNNTDLKGNGTLTGDLTSAETFTGQTKFKGTLQGNNINETADIKGRWINATCEATVPAQ